MPARPLHLGIRAEDIYLSEQSSRHIVPVMEQSIHALEHTGSESMLHFENGDKNLVAKTKPDHGLTRGDAVTLHFDLQKIQFFDGETEGVI